MFFFLATADADGRPDCSFKGGTPGFVRIVGEGELAFRDYDGNGMFKSLGNILVNREVGCSSTWARNRGVCGSTARQASAATIR